MVPSLKEPLPPLLEEEEEEEEEGCRVFLVEVATLDGWALVEVLTSKPLPSSAPTYSTTVTTSTSLLMACLSSWSCLGEGAAATMEAANRTQLNFIVKSIVANKGAY